jgi:hypothetical protein
MVAFLMMPLICIPRPSPITQRTLLQVKNYTEALIGH